MCRCYNYVLISDSGNVGVSLDKIVLQSVVAQHTVTNQINIQAFAISTQLSNQLKLFVNPWSLSLKVCSTSVLLLIIIHRFCLRILFVKWFGDNY